MWPLAFAIFMRFGTIVVPGDDEIMEGGYRGKIHLVPEQPGGKHLAWTASALAAMDAFFTSFDAPPAYRWRGLTIKFVRSVGKHTPSAYAANWSIVYNVEGSLMINEPSVLELLFHELFHTNDQDHNDWSHRVLRDDYAKIVAKCGTRLDCLKPYAPNGTIVRGGTYYAFQPNNGDTVHEYAAELAVRYFDEQREMMTAGKLTRPAFKCGPAENGRAWAALTGEFFGGRDLTPMCGNAH